MSYRKGMVNHINYVTMMGCFTANFKMPNDMEKSAYDVMLTEKVRVHHLYTVPFFIKKKYVYMLIYNKKVNKYNKLSVVTS